MKSVQSYIEKKANSLTKDDEVPYVKVYKIAKNLGYLLKIANLKTEQKDYLAITDFKNKIIYIDKNTLKPLMLYAIATQIGWIVLFPNSKHYKPLVKKEKIQTSQEKSILEFTQYLLLPKHLFEGAQYYQARVLKEIFQTPEFICELRKQNYQNKHS